MTDHNHFPSTSVIVFDIGNVLVTTDIARAFDHINKLFPDKTEFARVLQWLQKYDGCYELGLITTENLLQEAQSELGIERGIFIDAWNHLFTERSYVLPFLKELHEQGYILAACSNTNDLHMRYLLSTFSCFSLIDHFILSYQVHAQKPSPEIYHAVEMATGKPSSEHLFLDDRLENIEGACIMGWDIIHFRHPTQVQEELFSRGIRFTPWK